MPKFKEADKASDLSNLSISRDKKLNPSSPPAESLDSTKKPEHSLTATAAGTGKKKQVVVDSWEDEVSSSDEIDNPRSPSSREERGHHSSAKSTSKPSSISDKSESSSISKKHSAFEEPPFFAPISPLSTTIASHSSGKHIPQSQQQQQQQQQQSEKRQTKTDAVARRMISSALGVRVRSTKEQREYEAAVKAAERKKIEEERKRKVEEEIERERVRREVWGD